MNITKFSHSCLFIEEEGKNILIDPGNYSDQDFGQEILNLKNIEYLLITHRHEDHFCKPLIKKVFEKFPDTILISNTSVYDQLSDLNIKKNPDKPEWIEYQLVSHEEPLVTPPPENTLFKLFNRFVDPGDSLSYSIDTEILAMPIQASWGSMVDCLKQAIKIKPKKVIPIHDWHWTEKARQWSYEKASDYLKPYDIEFIKIENGKEIVV